MLNPRRFVKGGIAAVILVFPAISFPAIDEVVVTARKADENLQDVPVAITALGAQMIEEARIENLDDVASLTPGLNFFSSNGEALPVPVIRGVAPTDIFGETNAAIFVDGVYVAGREGLNFSILDVERIEIVKGPQSALYGRNAFSGAINYVSKRPSDEFLSDVLTTIGNDGRKQIKGSIGGPLIANRLHAKLTAGYDTWDGSYENPLGPMDLGGYTYKNAVMAIDFMPTDDLTIEFNGYLSDDHIHPSAITGLPANCENVGDDFDLFSRLANWCGDLWDLNETRRFLNQGILGNPNIPLEYQFGTGSEQIARVPEATGEDRNLVRGSLKLDWDVGAGNITAITGYSRVTHSSVLDGSEGLGYTQPFVYCVNTLPGYFNSPANTVPICLDTGPTSPGGPPSRFTTNMLVVSPDDITTDISQEIRFASPLDRPLRYTVGTYIYKSRLAESDAYLQGNAPMLPAGLETLTGPGTTPPDAAFGPFLILNAIGDAAFRDLFHPGSTSGDEFLLVNKTRSYALFGTLDWDISEQLTADFQLRFNTDSKTINLTATDRNTVRQEDFDSVTGRAGLKYAFNDDLMSYASISTAEKSGGFGIDQVDVFGDVNPDGSCTPGGNLNEATVVVPFFEESILAYELGLKGNVAEDRIRYDVSVYLMNWDDIIIPQVFTQVPGTDCTFEQPEGFNTNAGDATVKGMEVQADMSITDNWSAAFGASWTESKMDNAQLESFADFPSFAPDGDVSGNYLLRQPKKQANATLRYERDIGGTGWTFSARGDAVYQSKFFGGLDNQWTIPSRTVFNGNLGLTSDDWSISVWMKNILNDNTPTAAFRGVFFGNTEDIFQQMPASSSTSKFFPWRISTTHPRLRTFGITVEKKFGGD